MVAVCGADNALIESPTLTAEHLSSLHWIVSYDATTQYTPADKHLRFAGVERQVEVVVQNFLGLPFLRACTNRLAILQQRLAEKLGSLAASAFSNCRSPFPNSSRRPGGR